MLFKAIKPKTIPKTAKATPKKQPAPVKYLRWRQFLEQLEDTAKMILTHWRINFVLSIEHLIYINVQNYF